MKRISKFWHNPMDIEDLSMKPGRFLNIEGLCSRLYSPSMSSSRTCCGSKATIVDSSSRTFMISNRAPPPFLDFTITITKTRRNNIHLKFVQFLSSLVSIVLKFNPFFVVAELFNKRVRHFSFLQIEFTNWFLAKTNQTIFLHQQHTLFFPI